MFYFVKKDISLLRVAGMEQKYTREAKRYVIKRQISFFYPDGSCVDGGCLYAFGHFADQTAYTSKDYGTGDESTD